MDSLPLRRFWSYPGKLARLVREAGPSGALAQIGRRLFVDPSATLPLARVDRNGLLDDDIEAVHEAEKLKIRASSLVVDASAVERTYPLAFEAEGRVLRYAYLPAVGPSKGLVVLFHGHDAFLHMGPIRPWRDFDLLAPWDTFGWQRRGSWFWGEKGEGFVERLVQALIAEQRRRSPGLPWFCTGGSMGGFAALYHGIKYGCDGLYVVCPQVDLARKVAECGGPASTDNPYGLLAGSPAASLPDPVLEAGRGNGLPPLFLIQNLYDHVNPFAEHAWRLLEVYNRKRGWYGLRIHPSVGHGGDAKQEEAALFFSLILEKRPGVLSPAATTSWPSSPS